MRNRSFLILRLSAVVAAVILASPAVGFEQRGFRSCMSLAEAQAVGIGLGLPLKRDHQTPLEDGTTADLYFITTSPQLSLAFVDGKLVRLAEIKTGGYETFAMTLEALVQQLGQPRLEAKAQYSIVTATWSLGGGEHKSLTISKPVDAILVNVLHWMDKGACR